MALEEQGALLNGDALSLGEEEEHKDCHEGHAAGKQKEDAPLQARTRGSALNSLSAFLASSIVVPSGGVNLPPRAPQLAPLICASSFINSYISIACQTATRESNTSDGLSLAQS